MNQSKRTFLYTLIFIPLFIYSHGIYKGVINENNLHLGDRGIIFPVIFFFGLYAWVITMLYILIKQSHLKLNYYLIVNLIIIFYTFCIVSIGYIIQPEIVSILRYFQFISYFFGIFIFYYIFIIKKVDMTKYFRYLFYLILFFIFTHYLGSINEIGIIKSLKSIGPNIFFFGIYQSRVYYPYILLCLFFFSINYIKNNFLIFLSLIVIIIYTFSLQVRGAFVSLIVYLFFFFIFKVKNKFILTLLTLFFVTIILKSNELFEKIDFGRFADTSKFSSFNGRIDIWRHDLEANNISRFLFGDMFYDADGISSHNQYINFYVYGGVVLILLFSSIIILFSNLFIKALRNRTINPFFFASFFVPIFIDLNLNVPLNNINSAIIYTFIWSCLIYQYKLGEKIEKNTL